MQRLRLFLALILITLFVAPVAAQASSKCLFCHNAMQGKMEGRKGVPINVNINGEKFAGSVHGSLECADCHVSYSSGPHTDPSGSIPAEVAELVPFTSMKSTVEPVALAACVKCHPDVYKTFRESVHGQNIFVKKEKDAPLCLDCHGSPHYITKATDKNSPMYHLNVVNTCGKCHEDKAIANKYNFSEHVIEKYKESFHGKKFILGHMKVPVCSSCHGGHNIKKWDASDSPTFGVGKVKTCGKCHIGATEKFAAAPAHKYIGAENPIPFYGEKLLILLLIGTFAFIFSHVVLEALAEIRDKIIGNKEDHK